MGHSFFGLNDKRMYLDEIFFLVHKSHFSYTDARAMPIDVRKYFVQEVIKDFKRENGDQSDQPLSDNQKMLMKAKLAQANPESYANAAQQVRDGLQQPQKPKRDIKSLSFK